MSSKTTIAALVAVVFVVGAGYFIYQGRPVMKLTTTESPSSTVVPEPTTTTTVTTTTSATTSTTTTKPAGVYAMSDVQAHGTEASCWATIGGNVYDLTTWIARHPGGPARIIGLCGTDANEKFTRKHGGSSGAKAALALLKIGTLE